MVGLVVLLGESFRFGFQGNRNIGSEESRHGQLEASRSHCDFFCHIQKEIGVDTEIFLNTYDTRYSKELLEIYKPLGSKINPTQIGLHGIFLQSCELIEELMYDFDFVLFLRVDLFLKDAFKYEFRTEENRVMWPSVCFIPHHDHWGSPRVSDTMVYVPSRLFHLIKERRFWMHHGGWHNLKPHIGNGGQGTFLKTLHDSDSAKDWNPIYRMSNRPENSKWHSKGFTFTEDAQIIKDEDGSVFWSASI